jgi:hypothetical protein
LALWHHVPELSKAELKHKAHSQGQRHESSFWSYPLIHRLYLDHPLFQEADPKEKKEIQRNFEVYRRRFESRSSSRRLSVFQTWLRRHRIFMAGGRL